MAEAKCPASCGELIQGWISGGEKLVSCPIDWFSTVEVIEGERLPHERPRMRQILESVVAYFGHSQSVSASLRIELESSIPVGKGLASSTADIAAAAVATARCLGEYLDESALASLCVRIEPTDSTLFQRLTLFDHLNARTQLPCAGAPAFELLVLEGREVLLTEDYHRLDKHATLQKNADALDCAWHKLQLGCVKQDCRLIGEAATLSALCSEQILAKPMFNQLRGLVEKLDLYGLNVAHSGNVVGLMLNRHRHDLEHLLWQLNKLDVGRYYPRRYTLKTVTGGVR